MHSAKQQGKMNFKKITAWLHLYLGLISGIIVCVECITGACLIFEQDIKAFYYTESIPKIPERKDTEILKPSVFSAKMKSLAPGYPMHEIAYSKGKAVVVEVEKDEKEKTFYFDPYQGTLLPRGDHGQDKKVKDFFSFALDGHVHLWLPDKVGGSITNYGTISFVFLLISGIVLWWPRNKAGLHQRLSFKWKNSTRWKRKNYDLHNILGFYFMIFLLLLALTGLRLGGIRWVDNSLYWLTSGGESVPIRKKIESDTLRAASAIAFDKGLDRFFTKITTANPSWRIAHFYYPNPEEKTATLSSSIKFYQDRTYDFTDKHYTVDQYTFKILQNLLWQDRNFPDLIRAVNWDIHMGTIFDYWSKLLFFFTSLVGATLPVSGFLIWIGRKKKKKI